MQTGAEIFDVHMQQQLLAGAFCIQISGTHVKTYIFTNVHIKYKHMYILKSIYMELY